MSKIETIKAAALAANSLAAAIEKTKALAAEERAAKVILDAAEKEAACMKEQAENAFSAYEAEKAKILKADYSGEVVHLVPTEFQAVWSAGLRPAFLKAEFSAAVKAAAEIKKSQILALDERYALVCKQAEERAIAAAHVARAARASYLETKAAFDAASKKKDEARRALKSALGALGLKSFDELLPVAEALKLI